MIRGTNQEFRFKLSCAFADVEKMRIMFWQENNAGPTSYRPLPIVKVKEQCAECDESNQCSVTLNQEETLRFSEKRKARAQLRGVTYDGRPIATLEHTFTVYPVKDDSIFDSDITPTPTYENIIIFDGANIL